ncbi:MAG: type II toxin-antitoxin system VapC family toxin [Bacteroidales bacterium]|nr:type II toxin-antitoxin system VapC family toxin [Bacteroidales bacterium]MCF8343429.1 type II toxin-antitoxin system VapC family toxin [Bacteroidales bacterium]MCF8349884.1 type II toxin-antitoxin system VapC family toxin [Bacteroidales bacterium]MCF8376765.1 type II toxin-antitoxin system VapC family toxin [Bacteroidales bacterium]
MNLLIDTHAIIWFISVSENLPIQVRKLIEPPSNNCFVSIASYWEIGIKSSIGRLTLKTDLRTVFQTIDQSGFELLPITTEHVLQNADLDFHHADPFDRIIIAQAIVENLTVVTKDSEFNKYGIKCIWN